MSNVESRRLKRGFIFLTLDFMTPYSRFATYPDRDLFEMGQALDFLRFHHK